MSKISLGQAYLMGANVYNGFGSGGFDSDPARWVINGKTMTFKEFVDTIYPIDCAEKTMLILRLQGETNDNSNK